MNAQQHKKRRIATSNKYQEKIVLLMVLPTVMLLVILLVALLVILAKLRGDIHYGIQINYAEALLQWIHKYYVWLLAGVCGFSIGLVTVAFMISHHLVGPFTRILPELDDIIEGKAQKKLSARPQDELVNELLKRINVLIEKYNQSKS